MGEKKHGDASAAGFLTNLVAGAVSRGIASSLTYPLDRSAAMLRLQGANPALTPLLKPYPGGFLGFVHVIRQTTAVHGWQANYRGVVMHIVAPALVMTPLNFALKDAVKSVMPKVHPKKDYAAFAAVNVGSGFLAGLLALPVGCAVSWPVLRAKADLRPDATRLTASQHLRHMWATPGPTLSLIARAMPLAALGIPLFRGIYFGVNDTLRAYNPYQKAGGAVGLFSKFCVAQVASLSAVTAMYPMSVVIDRYVVANYEASAGIAHVAKAAMEGQGVAGLFRGYPSKVSTHVGSALILVLYGEIKGATFRR